MMEKKIILGVIVLIVVGTMAFFQMKGDVIDMDSEECITSKYNTFSNFSEGRLFFGKCYVPVYLSYETNKECGLFGISCYESSKTHREVIRSEACFKLNNGEPC